MAAATDSFEVLRRAIANGGDIKPLYVLHGEEGYYIDVLVKEFEKLIPEEDREFGLTVIYAPQDEASSIVNICRQIPMMTDRQVVIVKEAQNVPAAYIDKLARYAQSPTPTTVLVVCGRGALLKGAQFMKAAKANGVVFEAKKVRDAQLPALISSYIKSKGLSAEQKALEMLRDYIGTDLSRLYNEIDKLAEILGPKAMVTPESIERNIGMSKDYNNYELIDAIAARDVQKIFRIAKYFEANPKQNPTVKTSAALFDYFANLLISFYAPDRSERGLMSELNMKYEVQVRKYRVGMANYNAFQVIDIIDAIRKFDAMSKGSGSRQDPYKLFYDLLYRIASTPGHLPV